MSREQIAALGYMHPGRVDVITSGALILSRVMLATGATEFVASESDILDGIAWGLTTIIEPLPEVIEEELEETVEGIDEGAEDVFDEMTQELDED